LGCHILPPFKSSLRYPDSSLPLHRLEARDVGDEVRAVRISEQKDLEAVPDSGHRQGTAVALRGTYNPEGMHLKALREVVEKIGYKGLAAW
jgi:hypothetical protein